MKPDSAHDIRSLSVIIQPKAKPKAKPKAAAAPKATVKKTAAPKAAPKKLSQTTLTSKAKPAPSKKRPKPDTEDEASASEVESLNGGSHLSNTPPSAKKQKKATAPKPNKSAMSALQEVQNEAFDGEGTPRPKKSSKATDQYQKVCSKHDQGLHPCETRNIVSSC